MSGSAKTRKTFAVKGRPDRLPKGVRVRRVHNGGPEKWQVFNVKAQAWLAFAVPGKLDVTDPWDARPA